MSARQDLRTFISFEQSTYEFAEGSVVNVDVIRTGNKDRHSTVGRFDINLIILNIFIIMSTILFLKK